jgi:hypothetical protein
MEYGNFPMLAKCSKRCGVINVRNAIPTAFGFSIRKFPFLHPKKTPLVLFCLSAQKLEQGVIESRLEC